MNSPSESENYAKITPASSLPSQSRAAMTARDWLGAAALILILAVNGWVLSVIAFRGFQMFDFSGFFDAAWRVYKGQEVYIDFFYHTGPLHLHMTALFFHLFGFTKTALWAHTAVIGSAVIVITFLVTWQRIPILLAILVTALSATGYYWFWPVPWYDFSAHLFGLAGIAVLACRLPFTSGKSAFKTAFFCGVMAVLAAFTKTNFAIYGIGFFVTLLFANEKKASVAGLAAGSLAGFLAVWIFFIPSLKEFYNNAFAFYGIKRTNQFLRFMFLPVWFKNLYWLPALAVPYAARSFPESSKPLLPLFLSLCGIGLFTLNTGSHRDMAHLPVMGLYLGLGFIILYSLKPFITTLRQRIVVTTAMILLTLTTLMQLERTVHSGYQHYNLTFQYYPQGNYPLRAAPLRGWLFYDADGRELDEIVNYVNQNIPAKDSLLILTHMQIVYPLTGRESYRGVPFLWDLQTYGAPDLLKSVHKTLHDFPPDWILIDVKDFPKFVAFLHLKEFMKDYAVYHKWDQYALLRKIQKAEG